MPFRDLSEFVSALEREGELVRVARPVGVELEITEIANRCMKSPGGGPALLFERPVLPGGAVSDVPLLINMFGSERRMAMALGVERLEDISDRIRDMLEMKPPAGLKEKLLLIPQLAEFAKFPPRRARGTAGLPAHGAARRRGGPGTAAAPAVLAGRWGALPHAPAGDLEGSRHRAPQRGHVPDPGAGAEPAGHALAAPQERRRALAGDGRPGRAHAGLHRARRRPGVRLLGQRTASPEHRRVPVHGFSTEGSGGSRRGGHVRPRGAGRRGHRDRGLDRPLRRPGHGGPVRRPHRLLLGGGPVPGRARRGDHDAGAAGVSGHDRGPAADGRFLARLRDREDPSFRCSR